MASSSFEFKRKSLENIIESLLCYKCKAAPGFFEKEKNRYFCTNNSHQLCEECKSKCDCGSEVGKCPNPLVDQILKDLPTYCSHYKRGCRELFIQATDFTDHCQDCVFRLVYCPEIACQEKNGMIIFKDIADHSRAKHGPNDWLNKEGKSIQSNVSFAYMLVMKERSGKRLRYIWLRKMSLSNTDFFLTGKSENDMVYFWIYVLGSRFEAKNFAYTLSVTSKNGTKSLFYDNVKPLDQAATDIIAKKSAFMIGSEFAKMLRAERNENMEWQMDVTIHALKEEVKDDNEESGVEDESD